jgi:methylmalonyl-CoA mutase N-terminal domain/subunit
VRATRDESACRQTLASLEASARRDANLVPPVLAAVEARATLGEISDALRRALGEHRDTLI